MIMILAIIMMLIMIMMPKQAKDAKATKSAAERGIYWRTDIYDPHTGQMATQLGPSFSPMMKTKGIIHQFLATLAALDFTLVSKYCKWVGKS